MEIDFKFKPFSFKLTRKLRTSQAIVEKKQGWLIRLENSKSEFGWGEVSHLDIKELIKCEKILYEIPSRSTRNRLEESMHKWPKSLAFGIGAALAEIDGLIGNKSNNGWLRAPQSSLLLTGGEKVIQEVKLLVEELHRKDFPLTLKWKIINKDPNREKELLKIILTTLPKNALLRLDVNGSWSMNQAEEWISEIENEHRIEWIEQPLESKDFEGHQLLANKIPIALDESLTDHPHLINYWKGWQIRRPTIEGDPRALLSELHSGASHRVISTAFETGIGTRWVNHLAALQNKGPTPTAPGLAPGWRPRGKLFCEHPEIVWEAA